MKPLLFVFLAVFSMSAFVRSQEQPSGVSPEKIATSTTSRILGEIPDGTPPPPQPPKPGFVVAAQDVLQTKTYQEGGRTITFQRINPIPLPPPPEIPARVEEIQDVSLNEPDGEMSGKQPVDDFVMAGATVFHPKDGPPVSFVQVWPQGAGQCVVFWSSADFGLLSGFSSFIGSDNQPRSLMLMWSASETESIAELEAELGPESPRIPDFPDGKATFAITSDNPPAATILVIQSLHDIYNNDYQRLKAAHEGRERARIQREAELKANPPKPKNITLNFWRIGDHIPATGGGR